MARIRVSVLVKVPRANLWDYVRDISSHVEWMRDARAIRFVGPQRHGVGTTFECDTRIGPFRLTDRMEVTDWKEGSVIGVRHGGLVTGTGRFTLRWRPGGTLFSWEERLSFPRWLGGPVGATVARPVLVRMWRRNLVALRQRAERRAPQASRARRGSGRDEPEDAERWQIQEQ